MPSLDRLLAPRPSEQAAQLLQGELVLHAGAPYLRVADQTALWGPLRAADGAEVGALVLVAVDHLGDYWVVAVDG